MYINQVHHLNPRLGANLDINDNDNKQELDNFEEQPRIRAKNYKAEKFSIRRATNLKVILLFKVCTGQNWSEVRFSAFLCYNMIVHSQKPLKILNFSILSFHTKVMMFLVIAILTW